jgi:hypothetical protein
MAQRKFAASCPALAPNLSRGSEVECLNVLDGHANISGSIFMSVSSTDKQKFRKLDPKLRKQRKSACARKLKWHLADLL